ncbi:MAG: HAMP domain-containing sensor histidine kinase [Myxococcota bacterium]
MSRRRAGLIAGALAGVVLLGDAVLVRRALQGAEADALRGHEVVADRLFDELERELTALVEREEARSFLEYRFFYVPERQTQAGGLVRSPISDLPDETMLVGYFQIDPDGTLFNPARPRGSELQLALDNEIYEPSPRLESVEQILTELTMSVDWSQPAPAARPEPGPLAQRQEPLKQAYSTAVQSLNRATRSRSGKQAYAIQAPGSTVANFTNDFNQKETPTPVTSLSGDAVDVIISPMRAAEAADFLLLHRSVRIGAEIYRQGVALRRNKLTDHIEQTVLSSSEIADYARLSWGAGAAIDADYVFTHQFAEPFSTLQVAVGLREIPGAGGGQRWWTLGLSAALAMATLLGATMLYRAVEAELDFAERRNNFVAAVSHELKTPLTAIRMYGEMLRDGIVLSEEKRQQYYVTITAESERLSRLINNVLELSRLEKGNRAAQLTVGDVGPILEQTAAILRPHVARQGMTLSVEVGPGLPPAVVDTDALSQVLVNLVDNAVKFAKSSEPGAVRLIASQRPVGDGIEIRVRDHGPGVPSRQLDQIFEPFFRGERELTRKTKGTGIGLALVARLVATMGGEVRARNHPEGGLEVIIGLQVA